MAKPHEPAPPFTDAFSSSSPPLPTIPLTREQKKILEDPLVGDDVKLKILKENREAETEAISKALTKPGPDGEGGLSPGAFSAYMYQLKMVIYGIEKKLWDEELATDEAFRNKLEAIVKSEKAKSESGHYRDPGNRDR